MLADLDEADRVATALHATPRGTLRLYTSMSIVRFLAPIASEFLTLYPAVALDLTVGERMADPIEEGYDLLIRATPPPDSGLIVRRLTPWRHVLCCSPGYLAAHPAPTQPADLVHHNCLQFVFYPFGDEWRFEDAAGQPVAIRVRGNLVTNSGETLLLLTRAGHGLFLAPSFMVAGDIDRGTLVPLLPGFTPLQFAINAIYPHRHYLSTKVRSFIDLLADRFAEHRRWMNLETTGQDPAAESKVIKSDGRFHQSEP